MCSKREARVPECSRGTFCHVCHGPCGGGGWPGWATSSSGQAEYRCGAVRCARWVPAASGAGTAPLSGAAGAGAGVAVPGCLWLAPLREACRAAVKERQVFASSPGWLQIFRTWSTVAGVVFLPTRGHD